MVVNGRLHTDGEMQEQIDALNETGENLGERVQAVENALSTKYEKPNSGIPKTDLVSGVQNSLDSADSAYQKPAGGIPASDLADGVIPDISGKADKVVNAGTDNFAALDANGNLKDSGHKHSDYASASKIQAVEDSIAPDYADLVFPVAAGQKCYHENVLYEANQAIPTSEVWTAAHWETVIVGEELSEIKNALNQKVTKPNNPSTGAFMVYDGTDWTAQTLSTWQGGSY